VCGGARPSRRAAPFARRRRCRAPRTACPAAATVEAAASPASHPPPPPAGWPPQRKLGFGAGAGCRAPRRRWWEGEGRWGARPGLEARSSEDAIALQVQRGQADEVTVRKPGFQMTYPPARILTKACLVQSNSCIFHKLEIHTNQRQIEIRKLLVNQNNSHSIQLRVRNLLGENSYKRRHDHKNKQKLTTATLAAESPPQ
jgi:hypothetical protein